MDGAVDVVAASGPSDDQDEPFRIPAGEEKNHAVEIIPGLWLGDRYAAADRHFLNARQISSIVNCAAAPTDKDADWARVAAKFGFVVPCFFAHSSGDGMALQYMTVPVKDEAAESILDYLDKASDFIETALIAGDSVLVHCEAGRSRSATVVMAYLMRRHRLSLSEALSKVKLHRAVFPNDGFVAQLHSYGDTLGVKPAQADYLTQSEATDDPGMAVEKNMKTAMWRLQQGAWFTTPSKEVAHLQRSGYPMEECVATGILLVLDQDARTQGLLQDLFEKAYAEQLVTSTALCAALRATLFEDPAETEFPILQDILVDVPYAEQHAGAFLYSASNSDLLTPEFMDFIAASYPKVKEHMAEVIQTPVV